MKPSPRTQAHRQPTYRWSLLLGVCLLGLVLCTGFALWQHTPLANLQQKTNLVAHLHSELQKAQSAEKNALIAASSDSAQAYASQAHVAAAAVERNRLAYAALPAEQKTAAENQSFDSFSTCWSQLQRLSGELLSLSAQNTNVRARELSERDSAAALASLEAALGSHGESGQQILIAAYKIQALHLPHIFSPDDGEMGRIEQRSAALAQLARQQLTSLGNRTAASRFEDFMQVTKQIQALSRQNTNIHSAELELGKKDLVAAQCLQSLSSLEQAVRDQQSKATR